MNGLITIFGDGRIPETDPGYETARAAGRLLAGAGYGVCNGGYGGVMDASARGAKEAGGRTVGITSAQANVGPNRWIDEERKAATWRDRLFGLIDAGEAGYVFLDGATGTLTELFVVWEMTNKKLIDRPVFLLGPFVRQTVEGLRGRPGFVLGERLRAVETPEQILEALSALRL